jgi:hypothetical protein
MATQEDRWAHACAGCCPAGAWAGTSAFHESGVWIGHCRDRTPRHGPRRKHPSRWGLEQMGMM